MKNIIITVSTLLLLTACNNKPTETTPTTTTTTNDTATVNTTTTNTATNTTVATNATWIDDFKALRDAIYSKQKDVVASYFNFPITNNSNELWALCNTEGDFLDKPFAKADFMKYFDQMFSKGMVDCLLKVKSDELYKTGSNTTPTIKGKDVTSSMVTSYNKNESVLKLHLSQDFYVEDGTGGESDTILEFDVKDNKLKFKKVTIAG